MNSLNRWCQMASLVCCLVLGIEGFLFGHDVVTQARLMEGRPVLVDGSRRALGQETCRSVITPASARTSGLGRRESLD